MSRPLKVRQPDVTEVRRLHHSLTDGLAPGQRRRAEAILLYATGLNASEIAAALGVHINTIYADLRAFDHHGVAGVTALHSGGATKRVTDEQMSQIWQLSEQAPYTLGLPYGRWSLATLRTYLIDQGIVPTISREHLRRILKKGASTSAVSSAS